MLAQFVAVGCVARAVPAVVCVLWRFMFLVFDFAIYKLYLLVNCSKDHGRKCQEMSGYVKICQDMSGYVRKCQMVIRPHVIRPHELVFHKRVSTWGHAITRAKRCFA